MKIRLASALQPDSIVDGEGIRLVIWTQGCSHKCLGCHNPETHDFKGGFLIDVEEIKKEILNLKSQSGITLSGGDPFFQIEPCLEIAKYCHSIGKNVWCWTGYTFEELLAMSNGNSKVSEFLKEIDVLVDGKFILEMRSSDLKFRGSKNQRIIDVKKSLKNKKAILIKEYAVKNKKKKESEKLFI